MSATISNDLLQMHTSTPAFRPLSLLRRISALVALAILLYSCSDVNEIQIYDPNEGSAEPAVISGLNPAARTFAGVGEITILGTNFSATANENQVYFNGIRAEVISSTTTQIVVKTPNLISSDISVRVAVRQASQFSNSVTYRLDPVFIEIGNIIDAQTPYAIEVDKDENIYFSYEDNAANQGIHRLINGSKTQWAPVQFATWSAMKLGPDGAMYLARRQRALFRAAEGGVQTTWVTLPQGVTLVDFDFDDKGNIWTGGSPSNIYRVNFATREFTPFPFSGTIRSMRYVSGYLYISVVRGTSNLIVRLPIDANGNAGAEELYFDVTAAFGTASSVFALTADAAGNLIAGTDGTHPLIEIRADRNWYPVYPGLLLPKFNMLSWGAGDYLYVVREAFGSQKARILRIDMQRNGAPKYGQP